MGRWIATLGIATLVLLVCSGCELDSGTYAGVSSEDVVVYGSMNCGYTTGLMDDLDGAGIPYTFKDLDTDAAAQEELRARLETTDWYVGDTVAMPVVDVKGALIERPSLEEVEALL